MMHDSEHFMSAKKPLYDLGDLVASYYEIEGNYRCELGYITGIEHRPPYHYSDDWWYYVRLIAGRENITYTEFPESDIAGRVIHATQNR